MSFKNWNKSELISEIDKIKIEKVDNLILTSYNNRLIKSATVSNRYELFDIGKYLKDKIEIIEKNFDIFKYKLIIKGGVQSLELLSNIVQIGGVDFYKSFYIINSSDKSRRLSFNIGLRSKSGSLYTVSATNVSINRKHLNGVNKLVDDQSIKLNHESFNDQLESINMLVGNKILFSKVREIILGDDMDKPRHNFFDAFKSSIRFNMVDMEMIYLDSTKSKEVQNILTTHSDKILDIPKDFDFYLDAFTVFQLYLGIFSREDSHIVGRETQRIMNMTQWAIRNSTLESLGIYE